MFNFAIEISPFSSGTLRPKRVAQQRRNIQAGNFDYVLERKFNAKESIKYNRNHRSLLVSNVALFLLLLSVPILGWFLAAPLATSSATRSFVAVGIES